LHSISAQSASFSVSGKRLQTRSAVEGRLFPADFTGFVFGVLLCGVLSDRWGRKAVLIIGVIAYGLGLFLFALAPDFNLALLAAALIAQAAAPSRPSQARWLPICSGTPRRHHQRIQIAFGAGAALGPMPRSSC